MWSRYKSLLCWSVTLRNRTARTVTAFWPWSWSPAITPMHYTIVYYDYTAFVKRWSLRALVHRKQHRHPFLFISPQHSSNHDLHCRRICLKVDTCKCGNGKPAACMSGSVRSSHLQYMPITPLLVGSIPGMLLNILHMRSVKLVVRCEVSCTSPLQT